MAIYDGTDVVSKSLLGALEEEINAYKTLSASLAAADGDRDRALKEWVESSDDPQAVKLRTTIENARKKLEELAEKNVQEVSLSEEEKEKMRTELKARTDKIRKGRSAIQDVSNSIGNDPEGVAKALETLGDPTKTGRGRKPGSTGSSLPRVSVNVELTGGNFKEPEHMDSFSKLATTLNVDVKDLQLAFAEAAGVKHEDIKSVNKPVTFKFPVTVNDNTTEYTVATSPKERKKPGPRTSGKEETSAEESQEVPAKDSAA